MILLDLIHLVGEANVILVDTNTGEGQLLHSDWLDTIQPDNEILHYSVSKIYISVFTGKLSIDVCDSATDVE